MTQEKNTHSRRSLFAGAATVGALGAVAAVLPGVAGDAAPVPDLKPVPERGGGYQLSEHVKRYYKTTRV